MSVVIHSAATVNFQEPLDVAVEMNCVGTENVLRLMHNLGSRIDAFVVISTAYTGSNKIGMGLIVDEVIHPLDFDVDRYPEPVTLDPKPFSQTLALTLT